MVTIITVVIRKNNMKNLILLLVAISLFSCTKNKTVRIQSPDGKIQISIGINDSSAVYYTVNFEDSVVIQKSEMGFQFKELPVIGKNLEIVSFSETKGHQ